MTWLACWVSARSSTYSFRAQRRGQYYGKSSRHRQVMDIIFVLTAGEDRHWLVAPRRLVADIECLDNFEPAAAVKFAVCDVARHHEARHAVCIRLHARTKVKFIVGKLGRAKAGLTIRPPGEGRAAFRTERPPRRPHLHGGLPAGEKSREEAVWIISQTRETG